MSIRSTPSTAILDAQGTLRPMLMLALPALAEQTLTMLVGFSDTLLTGWYFGAEHLAASKTEPRV